MPVEIKELIIRATISNEFNEISNVKDTEIKGIEKIVTTCVDQVMKILENNKER